MSTDISIVQAEAKDVPTVASMWRVFIQYHCDLDNRLRLSADCEEKQAAYLNRFIDNPNYLVLLALRDGAEPVGYAFAHIAKMPPTFEPERIGFISEVYVEEGLRGNGVGRLLFDRLRQWFAERDVSLLQLDVFVANRLGEAFWKERGFSGFMTRMWHYI